MNVYIQTESTSSSQSLKQSAVSHACFLPHRAPASVPQLPLSLSLYLTNLLNLASEKHSLTGFCNSLYDSSSTKQPKLELDPFQQSSSDNVCALFNLIAPRSCRIRGITWPALPFPISLQTPFLLGTLFCLFRDFLSAHLHPGLMHLLFMLHETLLLQISNDWLFFTAEISTS